ncbi:MAG: hypothetical protein ACO2PP_26695 [Thermocrinis sp.]|jgi:hypothetical protein|uniref:hypothetical protein n=1 Tax=Thermocrinis sp. TaxID=2024383 RepID=UPI003C0B1066
MRVLVKEKVKIWVNGEEFVFEAGVQDMDDDKARILIEAGYAEKVEEPEKPKRKAEQ